MTQTRPAPIITPVPRPLTPLPKSPALLLFVLVASGCAALRPASLPERQTLLETETGSFVVHHAPGDEASAEMVRRALASATQKIARWGELGRQVVVSVEPTHDHLERAVDRRGYAWLRAWARYDIVYVQSPKSWSAIGASQAQIDELLTHELTHCVMYQEAAAPSEWQYKGIPIWFREGMASVTAGQGYRRASLAEVKRQYAILEADPVGEADRLYKDRSDAVYSAAHHAFAFLVARYGEEGVRRVLASMRAGRRFDDAFEHAIGLPRTSFEREFRRYVEMEGWRSGLGG